MTIFVKSTTKRCVKYLLYECICMYLQSNGNCVADGHGLVTIRMKPDDHGRFGFNVKVSEFFRLFTKRKLKWNQLTQ